MNPVARRTTSSSSAAVSRSPRPRLAVERLPSCLCNSGWPATTAKDPATARS